MMRLSNQEFFWGSLYKIAAYKIDLSIKNPSLYIDAKLVQMLFPAQSSTPPTPCSLRIQNKRSPMRRQDDIPGGSASYMKSWSLADSTLCRVGDRSP